MTTRVCQPHSVSNIDAQIERLEHVRTGQVGKPTPSFGATRNQKNSPISLSVYAALRHPQIGHSTPGYSSRPRLPSGIRKVPTTTMLHFLAVTTAYLSTATIAISFLEAYALIIIPEPPNYQVAEPLAITGVIAIAVLVISFCVGILTN